MKIHQLPHATADRSLCGVRLHVYNISANQSFLNRPENTPKFTLDVRSMNCSRRLEKYEAQQAKA